MFNPPALLNLKTKLNRYINEREYIRLAPKSQIYSDVYVVSFPKSGNTWLRFLIANSIKLHYGIDRGINFFTILEAIPDIQISRDLSESGMFGIKEVPRIIKSHSKYNPYYNRVILLVREPSKVLTSYYLYLIENHVISDETCFSYFIRDRKYGAHAWSDHTNSWIDKRHKAGKIIRVFSYEALVKNTLGELRRIMDLLGVSIGDEVLRDAVALCSKEKMRDSETSHMSNKLIVEQKIPFVRLGEPNFVLTQEDKAYIEEVAGEVFRDILSLFSE